MAVTRSAVDIVPTPHPPSRSRLLIRSGSGRRLAWLVLLLLADGVTPASAQAPVRDDARNGTAGAQEGGPRASATLRAAAASLRLRPGDAVLLTVQDEPTFGGEYPVMEDGSILLPLIGLVPVAGVPFADVRETVRARYDAELLDRLVVVEPLVRVRVLGEVRQPGLYLVNGTYSIADVVAQAGGLTPSAAAGRVALVRDGRRSVMRLREEALHDTVRPGDEVQVPRRAWWSENMAIMVGAGTSVLAAAITALLVR